MIPFTLALVLGALAFGQGADTAGAAPPTIGRSFGNGVAGMPICPQPVTIVNHTLSDAATHGVLHHFWETSADNIVVEYYIDGETVPSIAFEPPAMCGLASKFLPLYLLNPSVDHDLYHAGAMCGKNSAKGGFFNTFPIPFQKSAVVTIRQSPAAVTAGCGHGYVNVRGTENLPIVLPGSGIPLPPTARLKLKKNDWYEVQPADHVPIVDEASGDGLVFMVGWSVESQPVGGPNAGGGYIEGCWQFYNSNSTPYPGFVVGTGVEDYFDSSYYFGADAGIFGKDGYQVPSLMFRNELTGLTFFQRNEASGYERISAYRFHTADPLVYNGGGKLLWWVGQCKPLDQQPVAGTNVLTKCGNPYPPTAEGDVIMPGRDETEEAKLGRKLTAINVSTYGWYYTF